MEKNRILFIVVIVPFIGHTVQFIAPVHQLFRFFFLLLLLLLLDAINRVKECMTDKTREQKNELFFIYLQTKGNGKERKDT